MWCAVMFSVAMSSEPGEQSCFSLAGSLLDSNVLILGSGKVCYCSSSYTDYQLHMSVWHVNTAFGLRPLVLQTLFISSGCDYFCRTRKGCISFRMHGLLIYLEHYLVMVVREDKGYLSFVRLMGTLSVNKHLAEFTVDIPRALYMLHRMV